MRFLGITDIISSKVSSQMLCMSCRKAPPPPVRRDDDEERRRQRERDTERRRRSKAVRGAIHQLLNIILKLRILVLLLVSTLPCVVKVNNYCYIGE
jgi:hypothetical protein